MDVTDVTPGTYRLYATADPQNIYEESNEGNNSSDPVDVVIPGVIADAKSRRDGRRPGDRHPAVGHGGRPGVKSRKTPAATPVRPRA